VLWFVDIVHINVTDSDSLIIEICMLCTRYKIKFFRWLISDFSMKNLIFQLFVNSLTPVVYDGRKSCNQRMLNGGRVVD
jgi:hypothetical protein